MKIDFSSVTKIPAEEVLSRYNTTHEWNLGHVHLMAKCTQMDFYIGTEDPEFLIVFDPIAAIYRIYAESDECFKRNIDALIKPDFSNRQNIYIRVRACFAPYMEEVYKKYGREVKSVKFNLWGLRNSDMPHPDSEYVKSTTRGCQAPNSPSDLLPHVMKNFRHPILSEDESVNYARQIVAKLPAAVVYDKNGDISSYCCTHSDGSMGFGYTKESERNKGLNVGVTVYNYLQMSNLAKGNLPVLLAEIRATTNANALYTKSPMRIVDTSVYFAGSPQKAKL